MTQVPTPAEYLVKHIPRSLVLAVQEAHDIAAARAFERVGEADPGHLANLLGQVRHFANNEAFHAALQDEGCEPPPLKGCDLVLATVGPFTVGRLSVSSGNWERWSKSQNRKKNAQLNSGMKRLRELPLFDAPALPSQGFVLFVSVYSNHDGSAPVQWIAVPDPDGSHNWIVREPLTMFIDRYQTVVANEQPDLVVPRLKPAARKTMGDPEEGA